MIYSDLLSCLAERILHIQRPHPTRVAIDGIDAAGKTTLADALAQELASCGRQVLRASLDSFHRPRAERYRQGEISPLGYYQDSFDYSTLLEVLLIPLGPGGDRRCNLAVFDFRRDVPVEAPLCEAAADAILLFDGIFLLRPELEPCWDLCIFLEIDFDTALQRALQRDRSLLGTAETIRARYTRRYLPAQRHYLETVRPQERAQIVIDNRDPKNSSLLKDMR